MFGRDKQDDEDPFAALKEGGTYHSEPTGTVAGIPGSAPLEVVQKPRRPTQPGAKPRPQAQRRPAARRATSRRRGGPAAWLLRLIIPLGLAIAVIAVSHSSTSTTIPNVGPAGPTGGGITTSAPAVSVSHPPSYLNAKGLAAGLARVRHLAPGSKVLLLRIDSSSLSATVVRGHGQAEEILLEPSSTLKQSAGSPGSGGVPLSQINPAVPPRLISQLGRQFHVPKSHVSYLVAVAFQGLAPTWGIYLKNDVDYHASLSGAGLHKG